MNLSPDYLIKILEESQYLVYEGIVENVRPGHKHLFIVIQCQHCKRVHKCVAMVRCINYRTVLRQLLPAHDAVAPE